MNDPYDLSKDAGRRRRAISRLTGHRPIHPSEVANADLAADLRTVKADLALYRDFVRELLREGGALGFDCDDDAQIRWCSVCGEEWSMVAPERHKDGCARQRALALPGVQDGERSRVEGRGE